MIGHTALTAGCEAAQSRCWCCLPAGHETPHVCLCGGSFAHHGDDLWVYALPSCSPTGRITSDEALVLANEVARRKPLFIESRHDQPFRVSRGPIKFLRVPTVAAADSNETPLKGDRNE